MAEEEMVTIPKKAFMDLLRCANQTLAREAIANRQRPTEEYKIVFGGDDEAFLGFQDELLHQEVEQLKREGKWPTGDDDAKR